MAKSINYAELFTLRTDGRYQGYYYEVDENGKNKRRSLIDRDPEKLYFKIQEKEKPKQLTFREIAEYWQDNGWGSYRDGTIEGYEASLKRAIDEYGDVAATELSSSDIFTHLEKMKRQDRSKRTIAAQRTTYKKIYQFAMTDKALNKVIKFNPAVGVPLPTGIKKAEVREAPEDEVVNAIKEKADTAYFGKFALFLIYSGLRRGEALGLQWRDIDWKGKWINISRAVSYHGSHKVGELKTEAGYRKLPLLPPAEKLLLTFKGKDDEFVFPASEDPKKFMPQSTYVKHWNHYCKDMGFVEDAPTETKGKNGHKYIKHHYKNTLTAHYLRHGYATTLFEAGVDEFSAKTFLGHERIETTMRIYTHLRKKQKTVSVDKLVSYITNNSSDVKGDVKNAESVENT